MCARLAGRSLPELIGDFFVDSLPVANCHNPEKAASTIDRVDDSKASHSIFPKPLEFSEQRNTQRWILA